MHNEKAPYGAFSFQDNTAMKKARHHDAPFSLCAGGGNRTPIHCLEGSYSTTKLRPQMRNRMGTRIHSFRMKRMYER